MSRRAFLRIGGGMACLAPVASYASQQEPIRRLRLGTAWPLYGNLLGLSTRRLAQRIRWRSGGALGLDLVDTGTMPLPSLDDIGSAPLDGWHASAHLWPDAPSVWPLFGMRMLGMTPPEMRVWRNTSPGLGLREELARQAGLASWFTGEIGAGGVLVADGVWPTSGRIACPPGSARLWERLGFDVVATPPALGLIAVTSGAAIAAEVPPLLAGPVRRLVGAGLGYARFGGSAPGLATELVIKADIMADLPPTLAAIIAEACAEESAVFATEAVQEEDLWINAVDRAGLLVDVPPEAVTALGKAAGESLRRMESGGSSGAAVDAYRKMRRALGMTAASCRDRNIAFA
jgi:TRAP-type mannitol/chloroaromatic compound transport system substrate-binding protein